jgi:glycosyltransferase involved in cell wall biosynthesis
MGEQATQRPAGSIKPVQTDVHGAGSDCEDQRHDRGDQPRGEVRVKVRYDDQIFGLQPRGGISRYFVELMRAYHADPALGVEAGPRSVWTANQHALAAGFGRRIPTRLGRRRRVLSAANRVHRAPRGLAVLHHTYYDSSYLHRSWPDAAVRAVTVYDMIPELYPELFPAGNPHLDKRDFVAAADVVLCISEATRDDLVEVYGRPQAPMVVTPLGVDDTFRPNAPKPTALPDRYVLFVGNRAAYKDFGVLAQAFAVADLPRDVALVTTGGGPLSQEETRLLAALGLAERTYKVDLHDADLAGAYANALCFVFPSRHEGFGLPTLEAMASGCPTILACSSSHPEVGGDAALYFPPGDVEVLARLLGEVAASPELRAQRGAAGLARAATFSWTETARLTAAAYRDLLTGR